MPTSEKPTSYRLTFDPRLAKADKIKEAIDAILHHVGCGSCGRLSTIDLHIAERELTLPRSIEGLVRASEISK